MTPSTGLLWEVRRSTENPLLRVRSANCNITRRVLAIGDVSEERVTLAVERFGRPQPERMEIVKLEFARNAKGISREEFCGRLRRILAEQFPDEVAEKLSFAADLEHSLSRMYARGISRPGETLCAFLAVPESERPDAIGCSLAFAVLWLE